MGINNMAALKPENPPPSFSDYFRLDPDTQTLTTDCRVFHLRSKLWQLFNHLVNHPEKLMTREALIHDIWLGNHYTGEKGLTHAICHLRKVLKTGNIPAKIVTVPKKGYLLTDTLTEKRPAYTSHRSEIGYIHQGGRKNKERPGGFYPVS